MEKQWNKVRQIYNIFGEVCVELGIWKKKTWRRLLKMWGNLLQEVIKYGWLSIKVERGDNKCGKVFYKEITKWGKILMKYYKNVGKIQRGIL